MWTVADGILLAVVMLIAIPVVLAIITLPLQISCWFREDKKRKITEKERVSIKKRQEHRLREIENTGKERYPDETGDLRKSSGV